MNNFKLDWAEQLSDEIHDFEQQGGSLTVIEERLWLRLTTKIIIARAN